MGAELWEIELAWATTVHKAQGSESKAVIVVLSPQHRPLLTRRLFYTGVSTGPCPAPFTITGLRHVCVPLASCSGVMFATSRFAFSAEIMMTQDNLSGPLTAFPLIREQA